MVGLGTKLILRVLLNGLGLYFAESYLQGFSLSGGLQTIVISAIVLTLLFTIVRPILRVITAPLVWITFGLFNIVIAMALLWTADWILAELAIENIQTLFYLSIIIGIINII